MKQAFNQLVVLSKKLGIPVTHRSPSYLHPYVYDGEYLSIGHLYKSRDKVGDNNGVANFAHEIGHWMIATKAERAQPDFMLGPAVESLDVVRPRTSRNNSEVEAKASLIGIAILDCLGLERLANDTFYIHDWESVKQSEVHKKLRSVCLPDGRPKKNADLFNVPLKRTLWHRIRGLE